MEEDGGVCRIRRCMRGRGEQPRAQYGASGDFVRLARANARVGADAGSFPTASK
jgi:hypothetical protein